MTHKGIYVQLTVSQKIRDLGYLVIAKVGERLAVGKQATQRYDRQRFNLRKLNEPDVRNQYQTEITNRFAVLENLSDDIDIDKTWENIKENIKTSGKRV